MSESLAISKEFNITEVLSRYSRRKKWAVKQKHRFFSKMSLMLGAGIDLGTAIQIMSNDSGKGKEEEVARKVERDITLGKSLSESLYDTKRFDAYEVESIHIGEQSGQLALVLEEISSYLKTKMDSQRQVTSALTYPIIVVLTAVGTIYFMLTFMVPLFEDVFGQFGGELPYLTQLVILASDKIPVVGLSILIMVISIVVLDRIFVKNEYYQKFKSSLILATPFFGMVYHKSQLLRYYSAMHLLLSTHSTLLSALSMCERLIAFYPLKASIAAMCNRIVKGDKLSQSMEGSPVFDKSTISLIMIGEEVNKLDKIFGDLKEQTKQDLAHKTGMLNSVLEPALILFVGVFVALILIALYLPMFSMSSVIG